MSKKLLKGILIFFESINLVVFLNKKQYTDITDILGNVFHLGIITYFDMGHISLKNKIFVNDEFKDKLPYVNKQTFQTLQ